MKKTERVITLKQPEISIMHSSYYYTYPDTVVLKNKYGITDLYELVQRCAHDTAKEAVNLLAEPDPERFDTSYLKYLHGRLFQDVFEWAGCTRDVPFTFSDGTTATALGMSKSDSDVKFAAGREIGESLELFDRVLAQKNNLKGLSREEFVPEAAKLFAAINYIHPFREGNGRTQRLFFIKLARAAGHKLDFSAMTSMRMTYASIESIRNDDIAPLEHLFEDISNPKKLRILKRCIRELRELYAADKSPPEEKLVISAREGVLYKGICRVVDQDRVVVETANAYVNCSSDCFTPEQLSAFELDHKVTFKVLNTDEMTKKFTENISMRRQQERSKQRVQHCAKAIYGNADELNGIMRMIRIEPTLAETFVERLMPSSAEYRNNETFGREKAGHTENFGKLADAVKSYANVIKASSYENLQKPQKIEKHYVQVVRKFIRSL
ncbi:Fic family protein [Bartonella sp. AR 15-3]|uniref:Fic family protein n=1 Tax=Bartonella sp. AR 15-3 TaxID=545617 RepID=UPI0001F4C7F3|nr:Fic family protein [Bartonella sp. AR 15-3]OPB31354.1 Bartonella effector protein Bep2 [Bartonella sp. AR 15-3]CBI79608.1 Bartonella effector protein (Bep); substrate of VirB T4SS [Bartonella sp. AR 15-3]